MVLILEDVDFIRIELKNKLESMGYNVISSATSDDAYRKLMSHKKGVRVVILDIKVPISAKFGFEDGLHMYKNIPKDVRDSQYTIVLSGNINSKELIRQGAIIGVNEFIKKPYNYSRVLNSINRVFK